MGNVSSIDVIAAIFEEELKAVLAEKQAKRGKKLEFSEELGLSLEEFRGVVDFVRSYLSSSSVDVEGELNRLFGVVG